MHDRGPLRMGATYTMAKLAPRVGMPDLTENQYDQTCDAAGQLLEIEEVRRWVGRCYPYVVVDEAQDLTPHRLRIVAALENCVSMFAAADEFQCLSPALRPSPAMAWIASRCEPTVLNAQRRTNQAPLIAAAQAVRNGNAVVSAGAFRVVAAPGRAPFNYAATCVANAIVWNGGNDIALLTPGKTGGFATGVVQRLAARAVWSAASVRFLICGSKSTRGTVL